MMAYWKISCDWNEHFLLSSNYLLEAQPVVEWAIDQLQSGIPILGGSLLVPEEQASNLSVQELLQRLSPLRFNRLTFQALVLHQSHRWRANAWNVSLYTCYGGQFTFSTQLLTQNYLSNNQQFERIGSLSYIKTEFSESESERLHCSFAGIKGTINIISELFM